MDKLAIQNVAVGNHKGGVGKSTIAKLIACLTAFWGWRVLVIDTDPQASLTRMFRFAPASGTFDLIANEDVPLKGLVTPVPPDAYSVAGEAPKGWLGLVRGNRNVGFLNDNNIKKSNILQRMAALQKAFDLIVWDTPPSESGLHTLIYVCVEGVLHPTECAKPSRDSLMNTIEYVEEARIYRRGKGLSDIRTLGIVPNKFENREIVHTENLVWLQEKYPGLVWEPVGKRTAWEKAVEFGKTVVDYAPDSKAAMEAYALGQRFVETIHG